MKRIEVDGQIHEFPDDVTDDEINQVLGGQSPKNTMPKLDVMGNVSRLGQHLAGITPNSPQQPDQPRRERMGDKLLNYLFGKSMEVPNEPGPGWLQKLESVNRSVDKYTPSATTAATMAIPGLGLAPAAARTSVAMLGHGAEAGMAGQDPLAAAGKAGLWQGATEAIAPAIGKAAGFAADLPILGGQTRAIRGLARAVENAGQRQSTPAVAGEYMGKYGPTGITKGAPLIGGGTAAADVAPVVIPHPTIPGWTALDVLKETLKPAVNRGPQGSGIEALMRLLGTGTGGYVNTPEEAK